MSQDLETTFFYHISSEVHLKNYFLTVKSIPRIFGYHGAYNSSVS